MTLTPIQDLPVVELGLHCHKPTAEEACSRLAAIDGRRWAVLDFETASKDHPLVVEVACDGTVLLETLVDPGIPITQFVMDIHGISDADVHGAPTWPEAQEQMAKVLRENGVEGCRAVVEVAVADGVWQMLSLSEQTLREAHCPAPGWPEAARSRPASVEGRSRCSGTSTSSGCRSPGPRRGSRCSRR